MKIKLSEFEGVDASQEISLFEYGILWQKNEHCKEDELYFILRVPDPTGEEELYQGGYLEGSDLDFISLRSVLRSTGYSYEEWGQLPLHDKVWNVYNMYGAENLSFNSYGATSKSELIIIDE